MIKEEFVEVRVGKFTKKHYQARGYKCIDNELIRVKVYDLLNTAQTKVTAICSNPQCKNPERVINYISYVKSMTFTEIPDYYCIHCTHIKNFRLAELKQQRGELTRKDNYYFQFAENRINEFKKYIEKYKVIDKMQHIDSALYSGITRHGNGVINLVNELGYDINSISDGYIDNRGDINISKIECYFANYLIAIGLKDYYQRDVVIDSAYGKYNTDFVLKLKDQNKDICIEIWGYYSDDTTSTITKQYRKIKQIKESIYEIHKYTKILVSLEWKDFECNFTQMQSNFADKLKPYINMELEKVEWNQIRSFKEYSEEDLMNEILKYSKNGMMPTKNDYFKDTDGRKLYNFISRKFKNFNEYFKSKLNLQGVQKKNFWNEEQVNKTFMHMLNKYNKFLFDRELRKYSKEDYTLLGFESYVYKHGGAFMTKLKFCKYYLEELKGTEYLHIIKDCLLSLPQIKKVDIKQEAKILLETYFSNNE